MIFSDTLTLDAPKITREGYMAVRAKAARTGVYEYLGREVDPEGAHVKATDTVTVYRSEDEVFNPKAIHSFLMKPITDNHPSVAVSADNWSSHAKGVVAGAVRDGDYVAFDLVLMDAKLIADVNSGKRELSNGYESTIVWGDGVSPEGEKYNARQVAIAGNHVAVVDHARAGSLCRIADSAALCDKMPTNLFDKLGERTVATKNILVDGFQVEVTDAAEAAINKLLTKLSDAASALTNAEAKFATDKAALDAKIATLDAELATAKSNILTGDKLDAAVAERSKLVTDAKKIGGDKLDVSGTNADIKKRAVLAKLGDAYKDRDAAFFDAAFELQIAGAGTQDRDTVRETLIDGKVVNLNDEAAKARAARYSRFENASNNTKQA